MPIKRAAAAARTAPAPAPGGPGPAAGQSPATHRGVSGAYGTGHGGASFRTSPGSGFGAEAEALHVVISNDCRRPVRQISLISLGTSRQHEKPGPDGRWLLPWAVAPHPHPTPFARSPRREDGLGAELLPLRHQALHWGADRGCVRMIAVSRCAGACGELRLRGASGFDVRRARARGGVCARTSVCACVCACRCVCVCVCVHVAAGGVRRGEGSPRRFS